MPRPRVVRDEAYYNHPDFPHGTNAGYARRCKCDSCKAAHADGVRTNWLTLHPEQRAPYRKHDGDVNHPDFPHGKRAGYLAKCRCEACNQANAAYNAAYDQEKRRVGGSGFAKKAAANTVWRKSQKGIIAARKGNATRAARKRGASVSTGPEEQRLILRIYAGCPIGYEVDHIVPLSNGGDHAPDNLQYLPMTINRQKCDRTDYDASAHVIRWQDHLETPSTIIPSGSRAKRLEAHQAPLGL